MSISPASLRRRAGLAFVAGGAITLAACAWSAVAQATGDVPDDRYSAPFHSGPFMAFALVGAAIQVLLVAGAIGFRRAGIAGPSRAAHLGTGALVAGSALLAVCELAMLPLADSLDSSTGAQVVDAGFGVASLLVVGGMLAAGVATLRDGAWTSWRRAAPLVCGLLGLVVIPLQVTDALWVGVSIYACGYVLLGAALATDPVARPALQVA